MYRLIVAGGRDFYNLASLTEHLREQLTKHPDLVVVSGDARGADTLGAVWAQAHNVPVEHYPADWDNLGRLAGFIRNEKMAEVADALLAFWDGESRGTAHMIRTAKARGLLVTVVNY